MATLIRTEHIGLGAYLTKRRVPGATPECPCGYRAQTVKHILIFCCKRQQARERLFREAGTSKWKELVNTRRGLNAAARWMIHEAVLDQFSLARDEEQERDRREAGVGNVFHNSTLRRVSMVTGLEYPLKNDLLFVIGE